jgi:hypothetical protein
MGVFKNNKFSGANYSQSDLHMHIYFEDAAGEVHYAITYQSLSYQIHSTQNLNHPMAKLI